MRGEYEAKNGRIEQYLKLVQSLIVRFMKFKVAQVPRSENHMANSLANLMSNSLYSCHVQLNIMTHPSISSTKILTTKIRDGNSFIFLITNYLKSGTLPEDRNAFIKIKAQAFRYPLINDVLHKRSFSRPYQRCVLPNEAKNIIKQVHGGICNTHIGEQSLSHRIMT